jgi:NAD(P) transhydrogenase subunit alpha
MKIAVLKESRPFENRVSATPDTVKKFIKLGLSVSVEKGAGLKADISDAAYIEAGASIEEDLSKLLSTADIVIKVQNPIHGNGQKRDELSTMKNGAALVGLLAPLSFPEDISAYAEKGITSFALELLPRITRAQTMDALSSQSNLAGYRAVIDAANEYNRAFPMMMTAAGTIRPAHVLVLGAGVAGLQSIATAKRLGAVVTAFDVRQAAREEAKSLGAAVVEIGEDEHHSAQAATGYAREMSDEYKKRQLAKIGESLKSQDIVICTALIPGRPAPVLINEEMRRNLKPGSVVVDLSVSQGGNCAGSEEGKVVEIDGVKIIGFANFPARIATDASSLYARNLLNFLTPMIDVENGKLTINSEDEIVRDTMLTNNGRIVHPTLKGKESSLAATKSA